MRLTEERDAADAARLRSVFDLALDAIMLADDEGRYVDVNPAAALLLGYSREELLGMRVADVAWGRSPQQVEETFAGFLVDGAIGGSFALRHRSGRKIETEYRAVANILPGLHLSVLRDVTDRNAGVRALAASEARFRSLAETSSDAVAVVRVEGSAFDVEYVNPAGRRLLPAIVGRSCEALRACRSDDIAELHRILATAGTGPARATIQCASDGEEPGWLEVVATVLPGGGHGRAVQLVGRDVTAQERAKAALAAALRQEREAARAADALAATKQRILQSISHELRTPVTVIVGLAELLARPVTRSSGVNLADLHSRIVKHAGRIQRLLDDLLDVNIEDRGSALMLEEHDLAELVRAALDRVDLDGRTVTVDLMPAVASVDVARYSRIVDSLLDNVARHTPPSTHVRVRLRPGQDGARLTVADDGPGIPVEERASLFEPFHQGERATVAAQPGAGLGLALVRALAVAHGGRAWLEPTEVGTTIHVAV